MNVIYSAIGYSASDSPHVVVAQRNRGDVKSPKRARTEGLDCIGQAGTTVPKGGVPDLQRRRI